MAGIEPERPLHVVSYVPDFPTQTSNVHVHAWGGGGAKKASRRRRIFSSSLFGLGDVLLPTQSPMPPKMVVQWLAATSMVAHQLKEIFHPLRRWVAGWTRGDV
jgi:hypothetical protein